MAKISRRPRAQRHEEPARDDIFAQFSEHGRQMGRDSRREEPDDDAGDGKVTLEALQAEIARLQGRLEAVTDDRLLAPPPVQAAPQQRMDPKEVRFSLEGLPNPLDDRDGYDRGLQERISAFVQAQNEAVRQELESKHAAKSSAEHHRQQFYAAYPEWEGKDKLVGLVAAEVAEELGANAQAFIEHRSTKFYERVAKKLEEQYGALIEDAGDRDDRDDDVPGFYGDREPSRRTQQSRRRRHSDDGDDGRTAGMFSGMEAGGRPAATRRGRGKDGPGDMIAELHQVQRESGFF